MTDLEVEMCKIRQGVADQQEAKRKKKLNRGGNTAMSEKEIKESLEAGMRKVRECDMVHKVPDVDTKPQPTTDIWADTSAQILRWFEYEHLPPYLQDTSKLFEPLANALASTIQPGAERTIALRKLLEAKDAAVRATIVPGG